MPLATDQTRIVHCPCLLPVASAQEGAAKAAHPRHRTSSNVVIDAHENSNDNYQREGKGHKHRDSKAYAKGYSDPDQLIREKSLCARVQPLLSLWNSRRKSIVYVF